MLFSSVIFLFAFLPVCFFFYYVVFRKSRLWRNIFLLFASLVFYAWGEPFYVLLMIFSIIANWFCALMMEKQEKSGMRKFWLISAVVIDVAVLFVFKYLGFFISNIDALFHAGIAVPKLALPLGISFFTFQAMSYVIDIYRGHGKVQKNPLYVGLYIALFPQLVAGPIVRYEIIESQILERTESVSLCAEGIERFILGLSKKVLLANALGFIADNAFDNVGSISTSMAWLGILAYTLQIYFDFSGYSDMAIGLGKMFGFQFEENFRYPYISTSVSEFWRRWHISMGSWFRDYVYFPLGGSRVPKFRMIFNLFVVWLLTGLWHGANWTFVLWGLFFFVLIVFEKVTKIEKRNFKLPLKLTFGVITFFLVMMGWVLFRANDLSAAGQYFIKLFSFSGGNAETLFFIKNNAIVLIFACIFCFPIKEKLSLLFAKIPKVGEVAKIVVLLRLFFISVVYTAQSSYNPFIYFNF